MRVDWAGAIENENLGKIFIGGEEFTGIGYQGLMTVNTKTYVEEPTRSNDGSIPNINDHDTFIVPRCKVNFKFFNIKDYQRLCEVISSSNEFYVEYFDKQFGKFVKHKMYAEPEEMAKIYNVGTSVIGVLDYEVSFIGTLNNLEEFILKYDGNGGQSSNEPKGLYSSGRDYSRGDIVCLEGNRYFQAIWYNNKIMTTEHDFTDVKQWTMHNCFEYNASQTYTNGDIVYTTINENGTNKYSFYISVYSGNHSGKPTTDTFYWKFINVSKFDNNKTYTSNKKYSKDKTFGDFVYLDTLPPSIIYEAIYYNETFSNKYPTNTTYWTPITYGGETIKWGNSIVIADPETLFVAPLGKSHSNSWNTQADGSGFKYNIGQSINVYKNMTLYAQWE